MPKSARRTVIPSEWNVPSAIALGNEKSATSFGPATTTCAFCRPMNVMKKPMPTVTALFKVSGIALKRASRTFVTESAMKIRPSTSTAVNASCHE